jgi:pseudaminic acid biosynthesis-associated methylase
LRAAAARNWPPLANQGNNAHPRDCCRADRYDHGGPSGEERVTQATEQLTVWQGEFGKAYTDRNAPDWRLRTPAFSTMLQGLQLKRVLEVGCNRGHNLQSVLEVLAEPAEIFGVEPNAYALKLARATSAWTFPVPGNAFDLPFKDEYFDLVFTVTVLIHIAPDDLPRALKEIERVSRRYILIAEYFSEEDTVIEYRGHRDLLWKRNFLKHSQMQFPGLKLVRSGYWGPEDGFDRTHWWLMEK